MENQNEKNYYFIWLYISLLLHLLLVIIMISIKPSSSLSTEPDPAATNTINEAHIIFVDEPQQPTYDDDVIQPFQLAKKTQGSTAGTSQEGLTTPQTMWQKNDDTDTTLDTSSKALTDEHKKGLKDETIIKNQYLADDSVQEKVSAQELLPQPDSLTESEQISAQAIEAYDDNNNDELATKPQKKIDSINDFNRLTQDQSPQPKKQNPLATLIPSKMVTTEPVPKIESKKHQPIDIGTENRSKIELTKDVTEKNIQKKTKISLQDLNLQQGFNDFLKKGNAYFSSEGNSDKDNEEGFKHTSYKNQVGKMHESAFLSYPSKYKGNVDNMPTRDSIINMIIERSGKVTLIRLQSSGNDLYDEYHMKVLKFMGDCPPVPKFIESHFKVASILYPGKTNSFGTYQPEKIQF